MKVLERIKNVEKFVLVVVVMLMVVRKQITFEKYEKLWLFSVSFSSTSPSAATEGKDHQDHSIIHCVI